MKNPIRPVSPVTSAPDFNFKLVYFQFYRLFYYDDKSCAESLSIDYRAGILAGRLHKTMKSVPEQGSYFVTTSHNRAFRASSSVVTFLHCLALPFRINTTDS